MDTIPNGVILPEAGSILGFTPDRFDGYLWCRGDVVYVSFIISKEPEQGHFSELVRSILGLGFEVRVPTPMGQMPAILEHLGFVAGFEYSEEYGEHVEVWSLKSL